MQKPKRPAAAASTMSSRLVSMKSYVGIDFFASIKFAWQQRYSFCLVTLFAIATERLGGQGETNDKRSTDCADTQRANWAKKDPKQDQFQEEDEISPHIGTFRKRGFSQGHWPRRKPPDGMVVSKTRWESRLVGIGGGRNGERGCRCGCNSPLSFFLGLSLLRMVDGRTDLLVPAIRENELLGKKSRTMQDFYGPLHSLGKFPSQKDSGRSHGLLKNTPLRSDNDTSPRTAGGRERREEGKAVSWLYRGRAGGLRKAAAQCTCVRNGRGLLVLAPGPWHDGNFSSNGRTECIGGLNEVVDDCPKKGEVRDVSVRIQQREKEKEDGKVSSRRMCATPPFPSFPSVSCLSLFFVLHAVDGRRPGDDKRTASGRQIEKDGRLNAAVAASRGQGSFPKITSHDIFACLLLLPKLLFPSPANQVYTFPDLCAVLDPLSPVPRFNLCLLSLAETGPLLSTDYYASPRLYQHGFRPLLLLCLCWDIGGGGGGRTEYMPLQSACCRLCTSIHMDGCPATHPLWPGNHQPLKRSLSLSRSLSVSPHIFTQQLIDAGIVA
ncbi:hypothetical protein CCUS01_08712 [Colletotrichum cuscutae]|uniref:Uncharacterized protein n=1 Tax=Colletotrichum cuscutae TaxID=1209917 RepID=A0AAI9ULC3_9PEZI|nr:hypothetical protein CCUS01_08712 [Colletotrichum cuscutae]